MSPLTYCAITVSLTDDLPSALITDLSASRLICDIILSSLESFSSAPISYNPSTLCWSSMSVNTSLSVCPLLTTLSTSIKRCKSPLCGSTNHASLAPVTLFSQVAVPLSLLTIALFTRLFTIFEPVVTKRYSIELG